MDLNIESSRFNEKSELIDWLAGTSKGRSVNFVWILSFFVVSSHIVFVRFPLQLHAFSKARFWFARIQSDSQKDVYLTYTHTHARMRKHAHTRIAP